MNRQRAWHKKSSVRWLLAIILLLPVAWIISEHWDSLRRTLQVSPLLLFKLTALTIVSWLMSILAYVALLPIGRTFGHLLRLSRIHFACGLLNYLPIRVGTGLRLPLMAQMPGSSWHWALSAMLLSSVVAIVVAALVFVGLLPFLKLVSDQSLADLLLPLLAILAGVLLLAYWIARSGRRASAQSRIRQWLSELLTQVRVHSRVVPVIALLHLVSFLAVGLRLGLAGAVFGLDIALVDLLVLGTVAYLTLIIAITPGGLGTHELSLGAAAVAMGYPLEQTIAAVLLVRVVILGCYLALGAPSLVGLTLPHDTRPKDLANEQQ